MELHGNNVSLACFHGINFKSKSWALFSLREPSINFNTESQEIPSTTGRYFFVNILNYVEVCMFYNLITACWK